MSDEEKKFIEDNHAKAKKDPAKEGEKKVKCYVKIKSWKWLNLQFKVNRKNYNMIEASIEGAYN